MASIVNSPELWANPALHTAPAVTNTDPDATIIAFLLDEVFTARSNTYVNDTIRAECLSELIAVQFKDKGVVAIIDAVSAKLRSGDATANKDGAVVSLVCYGLHTAREKGTTFAAAQVAEIIGWLAEDLAWERDNGNMFSLATFIFELLEEIGTAANIPDLERIRPRATTRSLERALDDAIEACRTRP